MCVRRSSRSTSLTKTWRKVTVVIKILMEGGQQCSTMIKIIQKKVHYDHNDQNPYGRWSTRLGGWRSSGCKTAPPRPPLLRRLLRLSRRPRLRSAGMWRSRQVTWKHTVGKSHLKWGTPARTKSGRIRTTLIGNPDIRFQANEGVQKSISNNIR